MYVRHPIERRRSTVQAAVARTLLGTVLVAPGFAAAQQADDEERLQEVVVTGSLIQRGGNNTAVSPIVTVSEEAIRESGAANVVDALNQLPGFTVGGNASTGGQGTGGRATINLHGLGTNRNLVLLDGKRLPISDISGNVDVNILPDAIIGGIDAITGGASAIYGSDAMSGVVNFKTVRSLDGARADVMYSLSDRGDAKRMNASLTFGTAYAESRGNLIAAFSYAKQDPLNGSTREFFHDKTPSSFIGTGTFVPSATNAPNAAVLQTLFTGYGIAGARNPLLNLGFNDNGTLFVQTGAVNYQGPADGNGYMVTAGNVRMPVGQQIDYINGFERKTAFLKTDYKLSDSYSAYAQFMYVDPTVSTASGGSLTQFPALTTIPVTNPFIPADLRTVLASRPTPDAPFAWNARYVGVPYKGWDENYQVQQYMLGLKGDIAADWNFDVFASYDQSVHDQTMHHAVLKSQVQRLLNAPDGGASLCAGGFNPFGDANARSLSSQCQAFITKDAFSKETLDQTQFQAQVNGSLFDLGAGAVQLAVVADYRRNTYAYSPDADLVSPGAFNVIVPGSPGGNIEAVVNTLPVPRQSLAVKELAAQIDVPLISERRFVHELGVGAAARVSDYSVTGSVTSYEVDARWRPVQSMLIRASYQRASRAPNIGELFSPPQGAQLVIGTPPSALGDPCDVRSTARTGPNGAQVAALCVAQGVPAAAIGSYIFPTTATGNVVSGNVDLSAEKANTYNVGLVFNAPRSDGLFGDFSASVDYFSISIDDVISTVPGLTVLSQCYNLDGSNPNYDPNSEACGLLTRDSTGQLLTVATPFDNLGSLKTDGVELQGHWRLPLLEQQLGGRFYLDAALTWLNSYRIQLLPGAAFADYTGVSNGGANPGAVPPRAAPDLRGLTTLGFKGNALGAGLRWRYQASMDDVSSVLTPNNAQVGVPAYSLWDLFASYRFGEGFELRGGVNNLFDKEPPFVASSQTGIDVALYDVIGRTYYLGLRASF
jgi:outer membrane receptor protein involved in Fe transport